MDGGRSGLSELMLSQEVTAALRLAVMVRGRLFFRATRLIVVSAGLKGKVNLAVERLRGEDVQIVYQFTLQIQVMGPNLLLPSSIGGWAIVIARC